MAGLYVCCDGLSNRVTTLGASLFHHSWVPKCPIFKSMPLRHKPEQARKQRQAIDRSPFLSLVHCSMFNATIKRQAPAATIDHILDLKKLFWLVRRKMQF